MLITHIHGLHQLDCISTMQGKNALRGQIQTRLRCFIPRYGLEEFRFQIEVSAIVSTLQWRNRHWPDPVTQRNRIVQTDFQQRPFGVFDFGGINRGVVFGFIVCIL